MHPNVVLMLWVPGPTLSNIVMPLKWDTDRVLAGLNLVQPEDLFLLLHYVPTGFIFRVLHLYEPGPGVWDLGGLSCLWKSILRCMLDDKFEKLVYWGYYWGPGDRARILSVRGRSSAMVLAAKLLPLLSFLFWSNRVG
jgi:hypothetical protein